MSLGGVIPSAQSHLWQPHLRLLQMAVVHSSERDYDGIMKCHGQNGRNSTQNVTIIIIIIITNPKPVYIQQGLAGRILGPGYSSNGYILDALTLWRKNVLEDSHDGKLESEEKPLQSGV